MTAPIGGARSTSPVAPPGATGGPAGTPPSLLPQSTALSGATLNDAMSALYAALSQHRQIDMKAGQNKVTQEQRLRDKAAADEKAALDRQAASQADHGDGFFSSIGHLLGDVAKDTLDGHIDEAVSAGVDDVKTAWNSPAFWNDLEKGALIVAKVAAVVGSVALAVATAGAGSAAIVGVALLLSAGGEAVSDTKCLDGALGSGASQGVGAGMELVGAVASGGSGAGLGAMKTVATVASVASGSAEVVAGGAHVRNADFVANVQEASADVEQAKQQGTRMDQLVGRVLDELKDSDKSHQRAMQSVQGAMQTNDQTAVAAASFSLRG